MSEDPHRVPPTSSGDAMPQRPSDPGAVPPAPMGVVPGPAPDGPPIGEQTLYVLLAISGGILLFGFLLAAVGADASFALTISFLGIVMLIVVLILGAAGASGISQEGRVAMGVLAGLLLVAALWSFTLTTQASYATCGAIAAAPALFALRAFTFLRDGYLVRHADSASAAE